MSSNEYHALFAQYNALLTIVFLVAVLVALWVKLQPPPLLATVTIFVGITTFFIISKPLWYDEIFTAVTVSLSYDKMFAVLASDVHPPLHYLMMFVVVRIFGDSEIALRMPSLIAGIGVVVVLYNLFLEWSDQYRARYATLLIAIMPVTLHYSSEARYPIFLALVVLASYWAIIKNSKWQTVLIATAPLLHATGLVYAIALCIMAWRKNRQYAYIAFGLSLLYLPMMILQSHDVANGFWLQLTTPITAFLPTHFLYEQAVEGFIMALVVAYGVVYWRSKQMVWGIVWAVPLLVFVVSVAWHPVFLPRALLASSLLFVGMLAISDKRTVRFVALAVVAVGFMFYRDNRVDYKALFAQCHNGSVITTATNMAIVAKYYAKDLKTHSFAVDNAHQWLSQDAKQALGIYLPTQNSDCLVIQRSYATTFYEVLSLTKRSKVYELEVSDSVTYEVWHG